MSNKRYSIIIPHYNSLGTLRELLDSIPRRDDIQVIVVDDNSTWDADGLHEYMATQSRVEFYVNDTGIQSAGACRNIGLSHAKGKWLLFADADDYFVEGFIDVTDRYHDSAVDVIFFAPKSVSLIEGFDDKRHLEAEKTISNYQKNPNRKSELRLKYNIKSPCSKMVRRGLVEIQGITFEPTIVANDVMFSAKLSHAIASFATDMTPIYMITRREGTLTTMTDAERFTVRRDVLVRRCRFLQEVLSKKDWRSLKIEGGSCLRQVQLASLGLPVFIETYQILRLNNIKTNLLRYFNPYSAVKRQFRVWQAGSSGKSMSL